MPRKAKNSVSDSDMSTGPRKAQSFSLRVYNDYGAKRLNSVVYESKEAFEKEQGIAPVDDPKSGDKVLHVVRNLAYLKRSRAPKGAFRAALHECVVLSLTPTEVRVRFERGNVVKKVKRDSLYRRKTDE